MSKARGRSRSRPDHYTQKAKGAGYAARSVYKLTELAQRFPVLSPGYRVLDLGAAPGSWSQHAAQVVGSTGRVVAVDFDRLRALESRSNVSCIYGDFTHPETLERIKELGPFDTVLSDAAPATTGNRTIDTTRSAALVESIFAFLPDVLRAGGCVVIKLFQGGAEQNLLAALRTRFAQAKMTKPKASRSESFEAYLVGQGFGE